jgi:hypothetical protein
MQVHISVRRTTYYSSIVEMDEQEFKRLEALTGRSGPESARADEEINELINPDDWVDDSLDEVEEFEEYIPEEEEETH